MNIFRPGNQIVANTRNQCVYPSYNCSGSVSRYDLYCPNETTDYLNPDDDIVQLHHDILVALWEAGVSLPEEAARYLVVLRKEDAKCVLPIELSPFKEYARQFAKDRLSNANRIVEQ